MKLILILKKINEARSKYYAKFKKKYFNKIKHLTCLKLFRKQFAITSEIGLVYSVRVEGEKKLGK